MRGQRDHPALPEATDELPPAGYALPEQHAQRPDGAGSYRAGHPDQRHTGRHQPGSGADLAARLRHLPPGHPSSPYDADGAPRPPVPGYRHDQYPAATPARRETPEPLATTRPPGLRNGQAGHHESPGPEPAPSRRAGERGHYEFPDRDPAPSERTGKADGAEFSSREPGSGSGSRDSGDNANEEWRRALPGLRDLWRRHEEKWPDSERPPNDRSRDEPGSWRSDNGQYLNAEENLVSDHARQRISDIEKKTTPVLMDIAAQVPSATLVGLEFRLKGEDRFKEKVAAEVRAKPERSIAVISESMPDALRYTYQISSEHYVASYWDVHESLLDHGYRLDFRRNTWSSSQYKGLNTRWRSPEGQVLEIQFHTPESFAAKQLTHKAYERIRGPGTSDQERGDLYAFQAEVFAHVPIPIGALRIPDYRESR